jgi:membrane protein DedA with SNARE-associated domain/membrane-associated phospholipid phosphatase
VHDYLLYLIALLAAFGEATAFVGLFVPGVGAVLAAGLWAAREGQSVWLVGTLASLGSMAGFGLSYHAGRYGGTRLVRWSRRAHRAVERATSYFERHGATSVFWGHFFGPVRAFIALAAGIAGLSPRRFWVATILAGLLWGHGLAFSGALLSGGLAVAEAELGRGSLLLAFLVVALYVGLRVSAALLALGWRQLPRAVDAAVSLLGRAERSRLLSRVHPRTPVLARWMMRRLSTARATGPLLALGAAACLVFALLVFGIVENLLFPEPLVAVDRNVSHVLSLLRTPGAERLSSAFARLGSGPVLAVGAATAGAALVLAARRFEGLLLLAGVAGGEALTWAIREAAGRPRPDHSWESPLQGFSSNEPFAALVFYGFLAYLGARSLTPAGRGRLYALAGVFFLALGAGQVYLGTHRLSDVGGGYALGAIWLLALVIAAEAHRQFLPPAGRVSRSRRAWAAAALAALPVTAAWLYAAQAGVPRPAVHAAGLPLPTSVASGLLGEEAARIAKPPVENLLGRRVGAIGLVLVGSEEALEEAAGTEGWIAPQRLDAGAVLARLGRWLDAVTGSSGSAPLRAPAYPRFWRGRPEDLSLVRDGPEGGRWTARLWRTGAVSGPGELWVAWVVREPLPPKLLGLPLPSQGEVESREAADHFAAALQATRRFSLDETDPALRLLVWDPANSFR